MIESTSSWTKASRSNLKVLTANCVIEVRKPAPGMSACFASQPSNRSAMPLACGIPPIPAGCCITRVLSVSANWPSKKNPSRGVVAIQFGLPRPALRKADWVVLEVAFARLISSSLISKGLRASNFFSVRMSAMTCSCFLRDSGGKLVTRVKLMSTALPVRAHCFSPLSQQHHEHHAPYGQQRISNGVGDGIPQAWDLALGTVIDHAERCCCGACTRAASEHNGVVEPEQVFSDVHRQYQRHGRDNHAPQKQAESELL